MERMQLGERIGIGYHIRVLHECTTQAVYNRYRIGECEPFHFRKGNFIYIRHLYIISIQIESSCASFQKRRKFQGRKVKRDSPLSTPLSQLFKVKTEGSTRFHRIARVKRK